MAIPPEVIDLLICCPGVDPEKGPKMEEIWMPDVDTKNTQLREMIGEIQAVLGPLYGWADDGKTDAEKFASELEISYR